jgi:Cu+-exporting ATPase
MAGGTDLAKSAGDVLLVSNRLTAIPETLDLSRRTLRIIRQNLFWAFAYNVAAIPLAMLGILSPGVAAGAMILSSLTVVGNALRLRR